MNEDIEKRGDAKERAAIEQKMREYEQEGRLNDHLREIDWENVLPVTDKFPYIPSFWRRVWYGMLRLSVVYPFRFYQAKSVYKLRVEGKENLRGVKSAILTSNHIAIFDCLVNAYGVGGKLKTVGAEFNNRRGRMGTYMRAGGMIPLSPNASVMRKFSHALEYYLNKKYRILFYPEQSMWDMYPHPRPFKLGAFHYAVKFNVPIVPMFLSIRNEENKSGERKEYLTLHIGIPIYRDESLPKIKQAEKLAEQAFNFCQEIAKKANNQK